jgi:hypothetical protein
MQHDDNPRTAHPEKTDTFDAMFDSFIPTPSDAAQRRAVQLAAEVRRTMIDQWCAALPQPVRPMRTVVSQQRIVLVLVERWDNRSAALLYIDQLLHDETAIRVWIEPEVVAELMRLASYLRASRFH